MKNGATAEEIYKLLELGSDSYRVFRDSPVFMGFKGLCPGVPQNSIRDASSLGVFQDIKIRHFLKYLRRY
jgi:hypothetical protein